MSSNKKISPAEILAERDDARRIGVLAHTMNCHGDFMGRYGCSCYTCRDYFDPTGEEDAKQRNAIAAATQAKMQLQRQNANCIECEHQHAVTEPCRRLMRPSPIQAPTGIPLERSITTGCPNSPHAPPAYPEWKPVCCQRSPPLNATHVSLLPPPLSATRQASFALTGVVGVSSSTESSPQVEDTYRIQEARMIRRLERMLLSYNELIEKLEKEDMEVNFSSHGEMALMQEWWEEIDKKIHATEALLKLLRKK